MVSGTAVGADNGLDVSGSVIDGVIDDEYGDDEEFVMADPQPELAWPPTVPARYP
jgi:hypothetical protein